MKNEQIKRSITAIKCAKYFCTHCNHWVYQDGVINVALGIPEHRHYYIDGAKTIRCMMCNNPVELRL